MNKEVRHLIIFEIIISLAIILISFFSCNFLYNSYNNKVIQNYSYIISNVKELYPSLDSEVVSIINKKDNYEVGFQLLEDYIQELKQLANNFTSIPSLDKQTKDLYKKIHLQPMDNKPSSDKVTQTFKFLVENLTTQIYVNIAEYYTQIIK